MGLLESKTAIVTGAASPRGLGKAMAQLFAEHGARVALLDLGAAGPEAAAADIGAGHLGIACDVVRKEDCEAAVAAARAAFGKIDVLVNNAGITQPFRIMEVSQKNYEEVLDVNLRGTLNMSQATIPGMREGGGGSIINVSSIAAQRGGGIFGGPHYAASKAAILGLSKAMARELAPDGIRSNAICPGFIDTDITAGRITPQKKQAILDGIPMGRAGVAMDVAGCALFLASGLSAFVTGSEVDVNGGAHIH